MYDFHYNNIIIKFKNPTLLFTDTDYLCYKIKPDIYENLYKDKILFGNSDYNEKFKYFFKENKKVIAKMKDKTAGVPIVEFC